MLSKTRLRPLGTANWNLESLLSVSTSVLSCAGTPGRMTLLPAQGGLCVIVERFQALVSLLCSGTGSHLNWLSGMVRRKVSGAWQSSGPVKSGLSKCGRQQGVTLYPWFQGLRCLLPPPPILPPKTEGRKRLRNSFLTDPCRLQLVLMAWEVPAATSDLLGF